MQCHRIGSLQTPDHKDAKFVQLYLVDTAEVLRTVVAQEIIQDIQGWLLENNKLVQDYNTAADRQEAEPQKNVDIIFEEKRPPSQHIDLRRSTI